MKPFLRTAMAAIPAVLFAGAADAHTGLGHSGGFAAGLVHPFLGLDHLIAMLAAGVYAGWRGGAASWRMLLVAMAAVGGGMLLGVAGNPPNPVAAGIVGSALLLGVALLLDLRLGPAWVMAAAVAFGLIHGHAHGAEMALEPGMWTYVAGLLAATASLLIAGAACGAAARTHPRLGETGIRAFGGLVGAGALFLAVG
ncbi:MAG: hypothetical protein GEU87_04585 [Alphaproteobacteria bacterium]|nr:hypothetical protein [Alphaproteobacteria bacterium]